LQNKQKAITPPNKWRPALLGKIAASETSFSRLKMRAQSVAVASRPQMKKKKKKTRKN